MDLLIKGLFWFNVFCLIYTLILSLIYILQLIISYYKIKQARRRKPAEDYSRYADSENLMPVSVLLPAFNEQTNIVKSIDSLMDLNYPEYELIVINDGSTDSTNDIIIEAFDLEEIVAPVKISIATQNVKQFFYNPQYPRLLYINKEHGGKADALNAGINASKYPLFVSIDADSRLEKDAVLILATEFLKDTNTVVAGGMIRISNGSVIEGGAWQRFKIPQGSLEKFQIIEYFRAFFGGRISWGPANSILIVSGAFGVFNKQVAIDVGGYKVNCVGEDMEIVVRIHRYMHERKKKYAIIFSENAVCWTWGPSNIRDLRTQRRRWQIGLMDTLLSHKRMFLNPRYGFTGLFAIPYSWIFEFLGAIVETAGYIAIPVSFIFGVISPGFFLLYLAISIGLGIVLSVGGLILEQTNNKGCITSKQIMNLARHAFLENFGYRQMTTLFRVEGIFRYRSLKSTWGEMERREFDK
jgi:cellulose synthase/poly-beta-1,6-N-acetylglucosamine synthase-like glycosyltransferase